MNLPKLLTNMILIALALSNGAAVAQIEVKGIVFDRSLFNEMPGVNVMSTSGAGTVTDSLGHYKIILAASDSIYFSYLNKKTKKMPVKDIANPYEYDISLDVVATVTLAPILVVPNSYHLDSLENRRENEKIFDYESGSPLGNMKTGSGRRFGMGFNLDDIFSNAKLNKSRLSVQRWFEEDERQNYVDHRFNKAIVKKLTGLQSPALDKFMHEYRPSYALTQSCATDVELYQYIQDWAKSFSEEWKQEHPDSTASTTHTEFTTHLDLTVHPDDTTEQVVDSAELVR
jgi:hypothetical protein